MPMKSVRILLAAAAMAAVSIGLASCGGSSAPKVTNADDALFLINNYMVTDADFYWDNAKPLNGPPDSEWSFWQADNVAFVDGNVIVKTQCFGLIPPYDDYGTQMYETSCTNVGGPPGS